MQLPAGYTLGVRAGVRKRVALDTRVVIKFNAKMCKQPPVSSQFRHARLHECRVQLSMTRDQCG